MSFFDDASLAFLPSGAAGKDGKAYSIKPTDGTGDFTFSRGSNLAATRVGADGLIEKGRENLFTQSNNFDGTGWAKSGGVTITSGQTGYDGSSDAWLLDASIANTFVYRNDVTSFSGVNTTSLYAKKGTADGVRLRFNQATDANIYINLIDGSDAASASGTISHNVTNLGSGWYRIEMTFSVSSPVDFRIYPTNSSGSAIQGNIFIQDSQTEIGLAATDYIESGATTGKAGLLEDEPRFDYSGGATCPSLLLEPSRTQYLPYTEWIGGWSDVNDATIDGPQSFTLGSTGARIQAGSIGGPSGNFVFYAVFDSADIGKTIKLSYFDSTAGSWNTGSDITIDSNGRAERLISTGSNVIGNVAFYGTSTSQSFTLKYCQFEQGSYPTSYIPNHSGGSVTRGADSNVASGLSSVIGQTEGTIFIELDIENLAGLYRRIIGVSDGTIDNSIQLTLSQNGTLEAYISQGGTYSFTYYGPTLSTGVQKLAITYKTNEAKIYNNGTLLTTNTSVVVPACSNLYLGKIPTASVSGIIGNKIKQSLLFDTAISEADAITLTTL